MNHTVKLYHTPLSGHCHRVELMLSLLGVPYETIDVDLENGVHKAPAFLKISPFGLVPAIDDAGYILADSNAILVYLVQTYAKGSHWMPEDPKIAAEVQRWLTIAADNVYSGPCAARLIKLFDVPLDHKVALDKSHELFRVMELHLNEREWLASDTATIADVACYSYIAHAPEGGVDIAPYPNLQNWLTRIEQMPNYVGMARTPNRGGVLR